VPTSRPTPVSKLLSAHSGMDKSVSDGGGGGGGSVGSDPGESGRGGGDCGKCAFSSTSISLAVDR
jgi:hypothetical protein